MTILDAARSWWAHRAAQAGLSGHFTDLERAFPDVGRAPEEVTGATPFAFDAAAFAVGEAYVDGLDATSRLAHGRHYTPASLAELLWSEIHRASRNPGGPVVDPACGCGALLIPELRRFVADAPDPQFALQSARGRFAGVDLDPAAVWLGNLVLAAELLPLWVAVPPRRRRPLPALLRHGDGLDPFEDKPGVVVLNPPYGRVRLSDEERSRWAPSLYGHANRYAMFLQAAIEAVGPGGVVGAVVPTSFLGGAYFQRLRTFLAGEAPLRRLVFVDQRSGVYAGNPLQETCLAVFVKGGGSGPVACSRAVVNGSSAHDRIGPATLAAGAEAAKPWLLPRRAADVALVRRASTLGHRLSDYGWRARTGPLVWNRHRHQISATDAGDATPILWASDLSEGGVRRHASRDAQRYIRVRPGQEFLRLAEPAVLVQRTTAPEQPRRLVVATLDEATLTAWGGAVVVENHVNVLRCSDPASRLPPALLAALLATSTIDRLYRCLTGSVAVSAYELEALPMPVPEVVERWAQLGAGDLEDAVSALYEHAPPP